MTIMMNTSRRDFTAAATRCATYALLDGPIARAAGAEHRFDLTPPLEGWEIVTGQWAIENVPGAAREGYALVQRATENRFNVIVAPGGPYDDVDVSVRFKPISGREDASGGIVFRFSEGRYYLVRANALEDNFGLYYYDRSRHEIASVMVKPPALGQWHTLRVVAEGDHKGAGSMIRSCSTAVTPASNRDGWAFGPRQTRSLPLINSSCARRKVDGVRMAPVRAIVAWDFHPPVAD